MEGITINLRVTIPELSLVEDNSAQKNRYKRGEKKDNDKYLEGYKWVKCERK